MAEVFDGIDERLAEWIAAQPLFFVATAPMSADGHVNCSPKGLPGTFAVLDENEVAYLDLTGSGAETIAHVKENGRIVIMFCAFTKRPRIVRLHGTARVVEAGATVLQPRGLVLDKDNVDEHLSIRDFHEGLRSAGVEGGGPPPMSARGIQRFSNALDRWLTRNGF